VESSGLASGLIWTWIGFGSGGSDAEIEVPKLNGSKVLGMDPPLLDQFKCLNMIDSNYQT
jgi:hypothetical protein